MKAWSFCPDESLLDGEESHGKASQAWIKGSHGGFDRQETQVQGGCFLISTLTLKGLHLFKQSKSTPHSMLETVLGPPHHTQSKPVVTAAVVLSLLYTVQAHPGGITAFKRTDTRAGRRFPTPVSPATLEVPRGLTLLPASSSRFFPWRLHSLSSSCGCFL